VIEINGPEEPDPALLAFQEYLQAHAPWQVVVPYANELAEAIGKSYAAPRILRDFQRLLSLIKAATILRHKHRQRDVRGRLIATLDDYRTVFDLVGDMYEGSATGASKGVREFVRAVAELQGEGMNPINLTAGAERLRIHKSSASRRMGVALKNGWLCNAQEKRGRPAHLILGEPLPEGIGLVDPASWRGGVAPFQPKPMEAEGWEEGEL
jgi:hypothetical protein